MRRSKRPNKTVLCLLLVLLTLALGCTRKDSLFNGDRAYQHVVAQCAIGPRPVGSEEGRRTAEYITTTLEQLGWTVEQQEFAYRGVVGRNLIASRGSGNLYVLGAHYDTRTVAERDSTNPMLPVPGANDGASGVAVLLELARTLDVTKAGAEVWLAFFDAEDQGNINGWPFSVGAAYMAENLSVKPLAIVVVDMVGDAEQQFMWERSSDETLNRTLWAIAASLGYENEFLPRAGYSIIDDHLPFVRKGLVAVDIIDFDYPYWHTTEDTPDKVSAASLQRVGRVLEKWLEDEVPSAD